MRFGAHLVHRTHQGSTFYAAARIGTGGAGCAVLMAIAILMVVAVSIGAASHGGRLALIGGEFALTCDDA